MWEKKNVLYIHIHMVNCVLIILNVCVLYGFANIYLYVYSTQTNLSNFILLYCTVKGDPHVIVFWGYLYFPVRFEDVVDLKPTGIGGVCWGFVGGPPE